MKTLMADCEKHVMTPVEVGDALQGTTNHALTSAARLALNALEEIIAMNIQYCIDKYGDSSQAETMSCVIIARKAISSLTGVL